MNNNTKNGAIIDVVDTPEKGQSLPEESGRKERLDVETPLQSSESQEDRQESIVAYVRRVFFSNLGPHPQASSARQQ